MQIHEVLGVPLFADHITALNASFDSKLADAGYPVVRQLAYTYADRGLIPSPDAKAKGGRGGRPVETIALDGQVD
jgi:hypothetical protein